MIKFLFSLAGLVAVAAGGVYVFQPALFSEAGPRLQCAMAGGHYLRLGPQDAAYMSLMKQDDINRAKLERHEALGCFPEGGCETDVAVASEKLTKQALAWVGTGGGNLLAGNIYNMLGLSGEADFRARQAESQFCINALNARRNALQPATSSDQPAAN